MPNSEVESNLVPKSEVESFLAPIPQLESRSDPVSTIWATFIAFVTFIYRKILAKKMMLFAAFGVVVAIILGFDFGITSLSRQAFSPIFAFHL